MIIFYDVFVNCAIIPRWSLGNRCLSRPRWQGIGSPLACLIGLLPKKVWRVQFQPLPLNRTKSERRAAWVLMGYVIPRVADSLLSTAELNFVVVIVSWNDWEVRFSNSAVDWKFRSPERIIKVDGVNRADSGSSAARISLETLACRLRSSTSLLGDSKCALPVRI